MKDSSELNHITNKTKVKTLVTRTKQNTGSTETKLKEVENELLRLCSR